MAAMSTFLSVREAAVMAGVSERTIRRWLRSGQVRAVKRGGSYRIRPNALTVMVGQDGTEPTDTGSDTSASNGLDTSDTADMASSGVAELTRLVREQQATIMELAGRVGYFQAENAQLRERLALMAPAAPEPTVVTEAAREPATRPWWRRVWRAVQV
jgi:excisionase family DNA binding protein